MYDAFSSDYDRFVNWAGRLAYELPYLEAQLQALKGSAERPITVLDAACGTGMHAIALAQHGYAVTGADLSAGMISQATANAAAAGVDVRFEAVGFGGLAQTFSGQQFDAVLCLGNSLPHLLTPAELTGALADFAACLRPGGLLIVQNRNFDAVMAQRERFMEPQVHQSSSAEWLFLRFYDYTADGLIDFNIITLRRDAGSNWRQQVVSTRLRPLLQAELSTALAAAGFGGITSYGAISGESFDPEKSENLIISGRKQ